MSSSISTLLALSLVAAGGGDHGGEHGFNAWVYFSTLTNFIVMFGFLAYVLRQPLASFLETRRENMAARLREAKDKQALAEKRIADYKHRLDHLEDEVHRIVESYEKEGEADRERMRIDAERAIDRMMREADFTLKQEVRKAEKAIREAAASATLEAAESMVKEKITDADQRRLADTYIANLETAARR